jgi:hypothetical protein
MGRGMSNDLPQLSPDGKWRWDGQRWVPNESAPPGGATNSMTPPVAPARRSRRWPWFVAVAAVLFVGVCTTAVANSGGSGRKAAGVSATQAPAAPTQAPTARTAQPAAPARDGSCSPQPCANDNYGWIVNVSSFKYDAPSGNEFEKPEVGNVYVTLAVTFTNKLGSEQHANPLNFVLLDGAGVKHTVTFTDACPIWDAVNLTPGASFGPKCLAFEATAGKPGGLTLVWTPSLLGGGDYDIKLS